MENEGSLSKLKQEDVFLDAGNYLAKRNEKWYPVELIHKRLDEKRKTYEYYVHFEGCDRRLDQWLSRESITVVAEQDYHSEQHATEKDTNGKDKNPERKITRNQRRRHNEINHVQKSLSEMDPETAALEREHEALTRVKYICQVQLGCYEMDTWYFSPYPGDYGKQCKLWICQYCLKYMKYDLSCRIHETMCSHKQPPGQEIYRDGNISIWEVDGEKDKLYCQNLCLLSKLFLDHKTLFFDVNPFFFYVLCETQQNGTQLIGYFSKEKVCPENNNVACIMTLPPFQRKGYGKLLIAFSYELSKLEGVIASPEKPLSDLGLLSYRSYWSWVLLQQVSSSVRPLSIKELSLRTSITETDIISTLQSMNLLKYWKGNHVICVSTKTLQEIINSKMFKEPPLQIDPSGIRWTTSANKKACNNIRIKRQIDLLGSSSYA